MSKYRDCDNHDVKYCVYRTLQVTAEDNLTGRPMCCVREPCRKRTTGVMMGDGEACYGMNRKKDLRDCSTCRHDGVVPGYYAVSRCHGCNSPELNHWGSK